MKATRTRTRDHVLIDAVRESPVDRAQLRTRRIMLLVLLGILAVLAAGGLWRFERDVPVTYLDNEDNFKYRSIGSEVGGSLMDPVGGLLPPYLIFKALPQICPDRLPGGYASLGMIYEKGHDLPIGVSRRRRLGFDQVGINCAACHTGTYRESPGGPRTIVPGMPAHGFDLQGFFTFVTACALDPRFAPDNVIGRIQMAGGDLGWLDRYLLRTQIIPRIRESALQLNSRVGVLLADTASHWGPGRVDTFNPYKAVQFNWNLAALPASELIGAADLPSLWNQNPRGHMHLHWDGNNDSLEERNLSAALGAGVTPVTADYRALQRIRDWIAVLPAPRYPLRIDSALAGRGERVYQQRCAQCHADHRFRDGQFDHDGQVGQVLPIAEIGTDRYRLDSYTFLFASSQYNLFPESTHRFEHFRKTFGYANQPLDGIWARAPYLHNGSVPTLRDLLEPPEARPKVFYRGYDVLDADKVGFRYDVAEEGGHRYFLFDTRQPGNGNGGHIYGTDLSADDKQAIVEYMKRF